MSYFDAVTSRSFKTAPDGRKVFFPWGAWGRGYTIASERDYRRLHEQLKFQVSGLVFGALFGGLASLALINGSGSLKGYVILTLPILLVFYFLFYMVWLRYWLPRLQVSDERYERLSLQEGMTFAARAHPAVVLWLMEIAGLAFVSCGILILILDPGKWLIALLGIVTFGLVAALYAFMLVLRRRPVGARS